LEIAAVANVEFTGLKYQFSRYELGKLSGYVDFLYSVTDFLYNVTDFLYNVTDFFYNVTDFLDCAWGRWR
jgi:hypothetical protein